MNRISTRCIATRSLETTHNATTVKLLGFFCVSNNYCLKNNVLFVFEYSQSMGTVHRSGVFGRPCHTFSVQNYNNRPSFRQTSIQVTRCNFAQKLSPTDQLYYYYYTSIRTGSISIRNGETCTPSHGYRVIVSTDDNVVYLYQKYITISRYPNLSFVIVITVNK